MSRHVERIWLDERQLRREWLGDPYELLLIEEFHLLVEAVCAQYEKLHDTKLVMRLLPQGCNMACWPVGYDDDRLRDAVTEAFECGFAGTAYFPSQPDIAERLWGVDGYFVATV